MNFTTELSPRLTSTPQPSGFAKYEFPSKKIVEIDWRKLASVDLHEINSGICSIELLQEHLNHIAFCQPETEVHIENVAGQRNILKMFRLAQLIIQYLFISQDYMESQLNQAKKEHQLMLEKYNEMKNKLKEQIDEAKKIKRSNKNLSDSMIHLNSLLSSIGALDHYQCPECPKAFRSKDFLLSHLQRKHPQNISLVNIDSCFVRASREGNDETIPGHQKISRVLIAHKEIQFPEREHKNENYTKGCSENANTARITIFPNADYDQPSTSTAKSNNGFIYENNIVGELKSYPFQIGSEEPVKINKHGDSPRIQKSNDIDLYKVNEMQKSFNVMNDIIVKLTKDVEEQKKIMKEEFDKRNRESMRKKEEKTWEQSNNEKMIKDLEDKIEYLQEQQSKILDEEKEKLNALIEKQEVEIKQLTKNLKEEPKKNSQNEKINKNLKSEIKILKDEINKIQDQHNQSIERVKSDLRKQYELKLKDEVENTIKALNLKNQKTAKSKLIKIKKTPRQIKVKEKKSQKHHKKSKLKNNKSFQSETEETSKLYHENKESTHKNYPYDNHEACTKNDDIYSNDSNSSKEHDKIHNKISKLENSRSSLSETDEDTSKWYSTPKRSTVKGESCDNQMYIKTYEEPGSDSNSNKGDGKIHNKKSGDKERDKKHKKGKLKNSKSFQSQTDEDTSKWYSAPNKSTLKKDTYDNQEMYTKNRSNSDSSSDEEHDKIIEPRYVNVRSSNVALNKHGMRFDNDTETSENENNEDKSSPVSQKVGALNLQTLIQRNPNLWHQMKKVLKEELIRKLKQFDIIEEENGITNRDLRSHLLHLIRMRKPLAEKHSNFDALRKSINNQVDMMVDEKKETTESKKITKTTVSDDTPLKTGFIKGMKNWKEKIKTSKASFSSNKSIHNVNDDTTMVDIKPESTGENEETLQELSKYRSSSSCNSDSDKSSKTEVDIHNERGHSIRRNLFSDSPLPVTPKHDNQNFFSNKTYGNIDEWDSESTGSSNSRQSDNRKSQNSLDGEEFHPEAVPSTSNNVFQYQKIKLKKPSGPMIKDLSKKIEDQLRNRSSKNLPGSVDLAANYSSQSDDEISSEYIKEIESIRMSD